jgi:hypothetical protein
MGWRDKGEPEITWRFSGRCVHWSSCYRKIRTTQELRNWDEQYGRAARSPARLPNSYDDQMVRLERSWKSFRDHQWKVKPISGDDDV